MTCCHDKVRTGDLEQTRRSQHATLGGIATTTATEESHASTGNVWRILELRSARALACIMKLRQSQSGNNLGSLNVNGGRLGTRTPDPLLVRQML